MIIGIDFDGTCVTHAYPEIGQEIGAVPVLKRIIQHGHKLMLWTMRGNIPDATTLQDAIAWFARHEIELWAINQNHEQQASGWSNSNKQYAHLYIDDAALGCPLKKDESISDRPFADWIAIEKHLIEIGVIS